MATYLGELAISLEAMAASLEEIAVCLRRRGASHALWGTSVVVGDRSRVSVAASLPLIGRFFAGLAACLGRVGNGRGRTCGRMGFGSWVFRCCVCRIRTGTVSRVQMLPAVWGVNTAAFKLRHWFFASVFSLAILALAPPARAQAEDRAAARALFDEGRQLVAAERFDAACPKFEAARKLFLSTGVLLSLADCYEHLGRTASAWTTLGEAAPVADRAQRHEDAIDAKRQQTLLAPRLVRIAIHVTAEASRLTISRDGVEVPRAAWDSAIPVDPGSHEVRAEAPGHETWVRTITVTTPGRTTTVDIPELNVVAAAGLSTPPIAQALRPATTAGSSPAAVAEVSPPGADGTRPGRSQRLVGLIAGGVGVVTMGVGGVLGLVAKVQGDAAKGETGNAKHNDSLDAANLGDAGTIAALVGATVTVAGVIVWLTAPKAHVALGTNGHELFLRGMF